MDFLSKDMRHTANCQPLVISLYELHCPTKELNQCKSYFSSQQGREERYGRTEREIEKLLHNTVRLAMYAKQIKFAVFKSNMVLCANAFDCDLFLYWHQCKMEKKM